MIDLWFFLTSPFGVLFLLIIATYIGFYRYFKRKEIEIRKMYANTTVFQRPIHDLRLESYEMFGSGFKALFATSALLGILLLLLRAL